MKFSWAVFTSALLGILLGQQEGYGQMTDGEDPKKVFDNILGHVICGAETCEELDEFERHQQLIGDEHQALDPSFLQEGSYYHLCSRFHHKMQEMELLHPELALIKTRLLQKISDKSMKFDLQCQDGETLAIKILDALALVLEKVRLEFSKEVRRPVPEVIVHPLPEIVVDPLPVEEIIAEEEITTGFVGSIRGLPGVNYPNYTEIPITSFSCSDKKYIPGFYADLETGCQVFHVCHEHRRESFLCPVGTTFNQPILACDYWYSSNCSLSEHYYEVNLRKEKIEISKETESDIGNLITEIIERPEVTKVKTHLLEEDVAKLVNFMPIKAQVVEYPEVGIQTPVVAPVPVARLPLPKAKPFVPKPVQILPVGTGVAAKTVGVAAKASGVVAKTAGVAAMAAGVAVPVKFAAAKGAAVPVTAVKKAAAAGGYAAKKIAVAASAASAAKRTLAKAAVVPIVKTSVIVGTHPLRQTVIHAKAAKVHKKMYSPVPLVAKKFLISPMTKKALAAGYLKLLKAKKWALIG